MTRYCSIPDIGNLRKWFEKNFHNACAFHDGWYTNGGLTRWQADIALFDYMIRAVRDKSTRSKILVYYPTILLTFALVRCFGWTRYEK